MEVIFQPALGSFCSSRSNTPWGLELLETSPACVAFDHLPKKMERSCLLIFPFYFSEFPLYIFYSSFGEGGLLIYWDRRLLILRASTGLWALRAVLGLPPSPGASVQHGQDGCSWQAGGQLGQVVQEPCGKYVALPHASQQRQLGALGWPASSLGTSS